MGKKRRIRVFTRHYQAAMTLAEQNDLIVTLPTRATELKRDNPRVVAKPVPFDIPLELKMAWSPASAQPRAPLGATIDHANSAVDLRTGSETQAALSL